MRTTIDSAGRLVIPKAMRAALKLPDGGPVELRLRGGHLEIEPAPLAVSLVKRGRLVVAKPRGAVPPLTAADVRSTMSGLRGDDE